MREVVSQQSIELGRKSGDNSKTGTAKSSPEWIVKCFLRTSRTSMLADKRSQPRELTPKLVRRFSTRTGNTLTTVKGTGKLVLSQNMLAQRFQTPLSENCEAHRWFAVRVRSNQERVAIAHLRERGYEEFAPSYRTERIWSDRKKQIDQYLFPGYVFCRFNPNERLPVLTAPGVVDLVGFGRIPAPIPEDEIERVRKMVESGLLVSPFPFVKVGETVLIERGPLTGVEGILVEVKGRYRLVVSINLLQRSVSAEVDRQSVRPVRHTAGRDALNPVK